MCGMMVITNEGGFVNTTQLYLLQFLGSLVLLAAIGYLLRVARRWTLERKEMFVSVCRYYPAVPALVAGLLVVAVVTAFLMPGKMS